MRFFRGHRQILDVSETPGHRGLPRGLDERFTMCADMSAGTQSETQPVIGGDHSAQHRVPR